MSDLKFRFLCYSCQNILHDGPVDCDLEDWITCGTCGEQGEMWDFPCTLEDTGIWTIGGHWNNDPLTELTDAEVLQQFFWLIIPTIMVHGCHPYAIGTLEHCLRVIVHDEPEDHQIRGYTLT